MLVVVPSGRTHWHQPTADSTRPANEQVRLDEDYSYTIQAPFRDSEDTVEPALKVCLFYTPPPWLPEVHYEVYWLFE